MTVPLWQRALLAKEIKRQLADLRVLASKPRVSYRMVADARLVLFLLDAYDASERRGKRRLRLVRSPP
jgi:hypothetical protein